MWRVWFCKILGSTSSIYCCIVNHHCIWLVATGMTCERDRIEYLYIWLRCFSAADANLVAACVLALSLVPGPGFPNCYSRYFRVHRTTLHRAARKARNF